MFVTKYVGNNNWDNNSVLCERVTFHRLNQCKYYTFIHYYFNLTVLILIYYTPIFAYIDYRYCILYI